MGIYASRFDVIASRMSKNVEAEVRKVIVEVGTRVILNTPVKTGRARYNWRARLNEPFLGQLPAPASQAGGEQDALQQVRQVAAQWKLGQVAHITNNLDYIRVLNRGSSQQAPAMFVENAILAAVRAINTKVFR